VDDVAVTRVRSQGYMTVSFNIIMKDLRAMGYDVTPGNTVDSAAQTSAAILAPSLQPPDS